MVKNRIVYMKENFFLVAGMALILFFSGCTGFDPEMLMKSNQQIKEFLDEHPNSEITTDRITQPRSEPTVSRRLNGPVNSF